MPVRDEPWPDGAPCWVDCQVDDPAAARDFYAGLFGWQITELPPEAGGYMMVACDGHTIGGIGPAGPGGPAPGWVTYFATADVEEAVHEVTRAGGSVIAPPMDVFTAGRLAAVADPAGARFALWQPGDRLGADAWGEVDMWCWSELHTRDYAAEQEFYATVFGWRIDEIGDGDTFVYSAFTPLGAGQAFGGLCDDAAMGMPAGSPSHWLTWFCVEDADEAARRTAEMGGTVSVAPGDSPFGRMVVVTGACGELVGLIDPTTTVGEPPAPPS